MSMTEPILAGFRGTKITGSISYTLVRYKSMSLKQILFRVIQSQIDLEDHPESLRLQHGSCSPRQDHSIAASLTLFRSSSREKIILQDLDLIRYNPDLDPLVILNSQIYILQARSLLLYLYYHRIIRILKY
jgi:hypothetical protein